VGNTQVEAVCGGMLQERIREFLAVLCSSGEVKEMANDVDENHRDNLNPRSVRTRQNEWAVSG